MAEICSGVPQWSGTDDCIFIGKLAGMNRWVLLHTVQTCDRRKEVFAGWNVFILLLLTVMYTVYCQAYVWCNDCGVTSRMGQKFTYVEPNCTDLWRCTQTWLTTAWKDKKQIGLLVFLNFLNCTVSDNLNHIRTRQKQTTYLIGNILYHSLSLYC